MLHRLAWTDWPGLISGKSVPISPHSAANNQGLNPAWGKIRHSHEVFWNCHFEDIPRFPTSSLLQFCFSLQRSHQESVTMSTSSDSKKSVAGFLKRDINAKHAEVLLYGCCLSSGLVDSTLYNAYNTFVSMQTGNTIFVGLGASNQNLKPYGWARSLTSIGCFVIGCFLFARLNRLLGPRRRVTLVLSFLLQVAMLVITASLVQSGVIAGIPSNPASSETHWSQEAPIVLLSIQSAGQIVASRALGFNEIPTVVITSLLCDLVSDPKLFLLRNEKRDRRMVAFVLTLIGAIAGGWITKATRDISPVLWMAAGLKLIISVSWIFWRENEGASAV
ncbi:hypothetical protein BA78_5164 [Aspergillus fumigatus]|nr:hypothetical protein BA78_5164 [Aspergillus fumigatus]